MSDSSADDAARKERRRESVRRWREKNPEKNKEQHRQSWQANRDRVNAEKRERYATDPAYRQEMNDRNTDYRENNRDLIRAHQGDRRVHGDDRAYHLGRTHGLDVAGWAALWEAQEGCCYLCGDELDPSPTKTHVEHYHGCAAHVPKKSCRYCQRGLACARCNVVIGNVGDDPELLRRIAEKLEAANRDIAARQLQAPEQLQLY